MNRRALLAGLSVPFLWRGSAAAAPASDAEQLEGLGNVFLKLIKLATDGALLWDRRRLLDFVQQFDGPLLELRRRKSAVYDRLRSATCAGPNDPRVASAQQAASQMIPLMQTLERLAGELAEAIKPGDAVRIEVEAVHRRLGDVLSMKGGWIPDVAGFCRLSADGRKAFLDEIGASLKAADACLQSLNKLNSELV